MKYIDNVMDKKPEEFKQEIVNTLKDKLTGYIDWNKTKMAQELFKK